MMRLLVLCSIVIFLSCPSVTAASKATPTAMPEYVLSVAQPSIFHPSESHTSAQPSRSFSPTITNPPPLPTPLTPPSLSLRTTANSLRRREDISDNEDKKKAKTTHSSAIRSMTDTEGKTIIVTTIIIISDPDPDQVYHAMEGGDSSKGTKVDTSGQSQPNDPNGGGTNTDSNDPALEEKIQRKQSELQRMVTIASLVGSLGGISVIAATIILVRMRTKKRNSRNQLLEEARDSTLFLHELENGTHHGHDANANNSHGEGGDEGGGGGENGDNQPPMAIPSAPPVSDASIASCLNSTGYEASPHRQSLSTQLQGNSPVPSAPTMKELDGLASDYCRLPVLFSEQSTSSPSHHHAIAESSSHSTCFHCKPLGPSVSPEIPPPAYTACAPCAPCTPCAPPFYLLPSETLESKAPTE
ncbi:hypothetical protein BDF14DRAFT_1798051 [Spinellus fusiger]|nr:hypothetical protein BDF14DRAFT_1798051 [Spinellus fusiger]